MPTEILQIAGISSPDQWSVVPTGASKVSVVNDASDTTFIEGPGTGNSQQFTLSTPNTTFTEDLDGDVNSLTVNIRAKKVGSYSSIIVALYLGGVAVDTVIEPTGSFSDFNVNFTSRPGGGAWTFADLESVEVRVTRLSGTSNISKLSVTPDYDLIHTINEPTTLAIDDIDSDFVTLTWTDNSAVENNYEIQRSLDGSTWATIATVGEDVETYTDDTVASVTHYYYRVRAINAFFQSDWSNEVDDTTPAYAGPALDPETFGITNVTNTSFDLSWVDGGSSDSFELEESADGGSTWSAVAELPKDTPYYSVVNKLPGSSYMYRVRGVNTVGNSNWVESLEVTLPERSFREFLQKEVLQDVVKFFGWYDRVKLPDQTFEVEQTFYAATNLSNDELYNYTLESIVVSGILMVIRVYKMTNTFKITPSLISELPEGTPLFGLGPRPVGMSSTYFYNNANYPGMVKADQWEDYLTALAAYYSPAEPTAMLITVAQNPAHVDDEGNVLVSGAAIGDDIIYVNYQTFNAATEAAVGGEHPFTMSGYAPEEFPQKGGFWRTVFQDLTITTSIDYSAVPNDASGVYDAITNEALLKIGYLQESDVPESDYQKFRDAGRVAAWRFVAYSSVHLVSDTETQTVDGVGSADVTEVFSQIFNNALRELDISEQLYRNKYEVAEVVVSSPVVIRPSSYSSGVTVRF